MQRPCFFVRYREFDMDGLLVLPANPMAHQVVLHWPVFAGVLYIPAKYVFWRRRRRAEYYRRHSGSRPRLCRSQRLCDGFRIGVGGRCIFN